ncbi:MAG: hypothetical protein AB7P03_11645 [Kofleriaceae bacterium]
MIEPRVLQRYLLVTTAVVAAVGGAVELAHHAVPDAVVAALSLSYEANVPTWLSSALLLGSGLAACSIAGALDRGTRWRGHWWGIAIAMFYASLDEAAELHEHLGGWLELGGALYFDWVVPATLIVIALTALYWPFARALPAPVRRKLILAVAIYLAGALVMELPLGWWTDRAGSDNLGYALIDWCEETLEMIGASLAVVALVGYRRELARGDGARQDGR